MSILINKIRIFGVLNKIMKRTIEKYKSLEIIN